HCRIFCSHLLGGHALRIGGLFGRANRTAHGCVGLPARNILPAEGMGGGLVAELVLLERARQGRTFRRVRTTSALHGGDAKGVQVSARLALTFTERKHSCQHLRKSVSTLF